MSYTEPDKVKYTYWYDLNLNVIKRYHDGYYNSGVLEWKWFSNTAQNIFGFPYLKVYSDANAKITKVEPITFIHINFSDIPFVNNIENIL